MPGTWHKQRSRVRRSECCFTDVAQRPDITRIRRTRSSRFCRLLKKAEVQYPQLTVDQFDGPFAAESTKHPVDMHRRQTGSIRDMLLPQRDIEGAVGNQATHVKATLEVEDEACDALSRSAASEIYHQLVSILSAPRTT
jgi:hypothetical protein